MKVLLVNVDSKIPNLALMQASAYHKYKGDNVGWHISDPDIIYVSCIFKKNRTKALAIETLYPEAEVYVGGSGVNYGLLPTEAQKIKPDYSIYPDIDYSMGFTTRGCIRSCPFCIVRAKEGEYGRWQHIKDFYDPRFKKVYLHDNNWTADKEWFYENSQWCIDNGVAVNASQGLDIRLVTPDVADQIAKLKWWANIHFAWDNMADETAVLAGIETLKTAGINVRRDVQFYVLVGFNTTPDQDKYRCRKLKELGTNAFVMPYIKNSWTNRIARWANRKWLYWSIDIDDFKPGGYQ